MNFLDYTIIAALAGWLVYAFVHIIKKRHSGGCCGGCGNCKSDCCEKKFLH